MSGYLPLDSTYSSAVYHGTLPVGFAEVGKNCDLDDGTNIIKIVPQNDYIVGVHPDPFGYFALQHGLSSGSRTVTNMTTTTKDASNQPVTSEVNGAYLGINSAYNGECSYAAYRPCKSNMVVNTVSQLPPLGILRQ